MVRARAPCTGEREPYRRAGTIGVVCLCCAFDRSLSPYYWGNVFDADMPFRVVVEHNHLFDDPAYRGERLVYAGTYAREPELRPERVEALRARMLDGLQRLGRLQAGPAPHLLWSETSVFEDASPVYGLNFGSLVQSLPRVDGVWMSGAYFVYPDSRNVNAMIRAAGPVVSAVGGYLARG